MFKCNWIADSATLELAKAKMRQHLIQFTSPGSELGSSMSLVEDFLVFRPSSKQKPDEIDNFLRVADTSLDMLYRYPQIKNMFVTCNTAIPSNAFDV